MKTIKKIAAMLFMLAGTLLKISTVSAQCINAVGPFLVPPRWELQPPAGNFFCVTTGTSVCPPFQVQGTLNMPGMGVNQNNPKYMLDILCDPTTTPPTNMDVNISSAATLQNVGYRIGDSMIIWHNGILSSVFVGVYAGGGGYTPGGIENTFLPKFC